MLLEVRNLKAYYGSAMILNGVNLDVDSKELVGLLGPNGAGKTTLLCAISGSVRREGKITFDGKAIEKLSPHEVARAGLTHCPERKRLFPEMTVSENLEMGAYLRKDQKAIKEDLDKIFVSFPELKDRKKQIAGTLSGGEQQMVSLGRALMSNPRLLCIDEPSLGLAPKLKEVLVERLREIQESGIPVLLVEQDASLAFGLTSRNYILSQGEIVAQGTEKDLLENEKIREMYLGI